MAQRRATQTLTLYDVDNGDGPSGADTLMACIQQAVDRGLSDDAQPIFLVAGNYSSDLFVGKQLCTKRLKIYSHYCCNKPGCGNKWSSESTTVEMLMLMRKHPKKDHNLPYLNY